MSDKAAVLAGEDRVFDDVAAVPRGGQLAG
jgi:hypothetical protein